MRRKTAAKLALILSLLLVVVSLSAFGCGVPWAASSPSSATAHIAQATFQLQAVLGLADRAITESSQPPLLAGDAIALRWVGGRADVDKKSGRIRAILIDQSMSSAGMIGDPADSTVLPNAALHREALRVLGLLGWDTASLEAEGFAAGTARAVSYSQVGTIYERTWVGHDPAGLRNDGVIQVGLDVTDGGLHSFLFEPGPTTSPDLTDTISKEKAAATAKEAASKSSFLTVSTTIPASTTSAATTKNGATTSTTAKPTSTTLAGGVTSAAMVHIDHVSITGGKDLVVWVIKLAADPTTGRGAAVIYVDALDNKALSVQAN